MSGGWLVLIAALGVLFLLFLVMKTKLQAFIALIVVSYLVGIFSGLDLADIIKAVQAGMGGTVGEIAVIIGMGAMFGEILKVSGGAERLALYLTKKFGESRVHWALALTGFIISIPVFLDVAFVILVPILYSMARRTKKSLLFFGIPLLAGLAVTHSFVPPTPGPIATAALVHANIGWVILFGLIAGIPATILAGPVFGKYIAGKIHVKVPEYMISETEEIDDSKELPNFWTIASLIILPLALILLNTLSAATLPEGNGLRAILTFIGNPFVALTITTLLTLWVLGTKRGYSKDELQEICTKALEPAGIIILITGAGGVFGQVLVETGVGDVLANAMKDAHMPLIIFAFLIAAIVRIAQGSATVAMITAGSLVSPVIGAFDVSGAMLGLLVIAISCGATIASHVNDSGFWLVNRFFGMSEKDTLKSWTVMETIIALVGFAVVLLISLFI